MIILLFIVLWVWTLFFVINDSHETYTADSRDAPWNSCRGAQVELPQMDPRALLRKSPRKNNYTITVYNRIRERDTVHNSSKISSNKWPGTHQQFRYGSTNQNPFESISIRGRVLWVLLHLALLDFAMAGFGASSFHDQVTWAALWQMLSGHGAAFWKLTWCVPCVYIKHVTCVWCWHMLTVWLEICVFFEWFWMYTWCLPCQCDSNFRRYRWPTGHPSRCRSKAFETRSETRWRLGPWAMPPSLEGFVPATFGVSLGMVYFFPPP